MPRERKEGNRTSLPELVRLEDAVIDCKGQAQESHAERCYQKGLL
jgi:hypothetical protein